MNKKIASEIAIGIILVLVILIGGFIWLGGNEKIKQQELFPVVTKIDNAKDKQSLEAINDLSDEQNKDLTKSFLNYSENIRQTYGGYDSLHIYIIKRTENNLLGHFKYKKGEEDYIDEGFTLATSANGKWEVIFHQGNWRDSKDFPSCETINKYNIPVEIFWPERKISC